MGWADGDCVQFSVVLKHLRKYRSSWEVDVRCGIGKHTALVGLCRRVYHDKQEYPKGPYDSDHELSWNENYLRYTDRPSSKITNCLAEVFGLSWDPDLARYEIRVPAEHWPRVQAYLDTTGATWNDKGKHRAVCLHYQGNTSPQKKNLHEWQAQQIVKACRQLDYPVVLLDWDKRSGLIGSPSVYNPGVGSGDLWGNFGSGDAAVLAALIGQCELFVGIDSGPGKVASATEAQTLICWRGHNPIQFHDPAPQTEHLVPVDWHQMPPINGSNDMATFFRNHYDYGTYDGDENLVEKAKAWLELRTGRKLPGRSTMTSGRPPVQAHGFWVHADFPEQDYVVIKDVFQEDCYKTALIGTRGEGEIVVDVGAHIGVFARLWHRKNPRARIACVECCPENIPVLRANAGDFATILTAACTYEEGPLTLLNAVGEWGKSTGGSRVVAPQEMEANKESQYWHDRRPIEKVTLEGLMTYLGVDHIDLLKLDCEGSEFSILEHADLSRIGFVVMETHSRQKWRDLWGRRFKGWDVGHMSASGEFENWHLRNPERWR